MLVRDVMNREVIVVGPESTLKEAVRKMRNFDIGILPVCVDRDLVGIVTDRDVAIRLPEEEYTLSNIKVRNVMSWNVEWCFQDDSIGEAVKLMENKRVRRLPVVDYDKKMIGILSIGDLAARGDVELAYRVFKSVF